MASALLQGQQTDPLGTCPQSLSAMPKACGLRYLALLILEAWIFMPAGSTSSSSRWRSPSALGPGVDCRPLVLSLSTDRDIAAIGREKLERLEEKLKAETRQTSPSEVAPSRLKALQFRQATNQELSSRQVEADKRRQLGGPQSLARPSEKDPMHVHALSRASSTGPRQTRVLRRAGDQSAPSRQVPRNRRRLQRRLYFSRLEGLVR